jgi:hypothetical protein
MTKLTLKNAYVKAMSGEDGLFAIVLACRVQDVEGSIQEQFWLTAEIKSNTE